MLSDEEVDAVAGRLASLYETEFGGKPRGRYRISRKALGRMAGRKRIYPETVSALQRSLFERDMVLIDLDSFFVVLSARTFDAYRRVGPSLVDAAEFSDRDSREMEIGSEDE